MLSGQLSVQEQAMANNRQLIDSLSELRAQRLAIQANREDLSISQERAKQELKSLEIALNEIIEGSMDLEQVDEES